MEIWLLILLLAPLVGVIINLLLSQFYQGREAGFVASVACLAASLAAVIAFIDLMASPEPIRIMLAPWIVGLDIDVSWSFQLDELSAWMALVVTIVSTLVHIYAVEYMKGEERFTTFFIYLNLFVGSMLLLALADNFLVLFVGWELVGLCSYLLIGFWFDQGGLGLGNARAGKKAFIANRIGDLGFLLALFLIFWHFGGFGFDQVLP
ncbi:MAG: proton-conducting transporter membrane subunit, partial [Anaerolineales bacterium]